jgi:hypothetical protein
MKPWDAGNTGFKPQVRQQFCDPRKRTDRNRFGVLYLGESGLLPGALLRDQRNSAVGDFPLGAETKP